MLDIFLNIFLLIIGMLFLIKGADFFVDGSASIARKLKIPSLVIGLTLVSMGTSAPEASVSISSSIKGLSDSLKSIKIRWSLKFFMFSLSPKYTMRTVIKTFDNIVDYTCVLLGGFLWEKLKNYL